MTIISVVVLMNRLISRGRKSVGALAHIAPVEQLVEKARRVGEFQTQIRTLPELEGFV